MNYQDFIKPELLILIPVLYFVGMGIKKSAVKDGLIPILLGIFGILLTAIYLLASTPIKNSQDVFTAIFTALTQGILCAAASVYTDQLIKQSVKLKEEEINSEEEKKED